MLLSDYWFGVCVWICQMKIRQLELKLQEEEHQRKLVQDKTSQVTEEASQHYARLCYLFWKEFDQFPFY